MRLLRLINAIQNPFFKFSGGLLLLAAVMKIISVTGSARRLSLPDPVLDFTNDRNLFVLASIVEAIVGVLCLSRAKQETKSNSLAWLSLLFLAYRVERWRLGIQSPCPCLGDVWAWTNVSPSVIDRMLLLWLVTAFTLSCTYALINMTETSNPTSNKM